MMVLHVQEQVEIFLHMHTYYFIIFYCWAPWDAEQAGVWAGMLVISCFDKIL